MTIQGLHHLFLQHPSISTDSRNIKASCIFFALSGENFDGNTFAKEALDKGASYVVVSKNNHPEDSRYIIVDNVLKTLQDLASFHRDYCKTPIIGLTGSNGKTTTKELLYAVLCKKYNTLATQGNFNNHIGVPLTLLELSPRTELAIVEMGANHPGEIAYLCSIAKPDYGYITNFGQAHLEGFGSFENVIKAKSELYDYLIASDKSIFYNHQDSLQQNILEEYLNKVAINIKGDLSISAMDPLLSIQWNNRKVNTQLVGTYNFANCATAVGIGEYFEVPEEDIVAALESYRPKNNRSQIVKTEQNTLILDAYNANPTSMKAAIESFKAIDASRKVLILGDMLELGTFAQEAHLEMVKLLEEQNWEKVLLVGPLFKNCHSSFMSFENTTDLNTHLKSQPITNSTLLLKGSRGIALENCVVYL